MSINFIESEIERRGIGYGGGRDSVSIGNIPPIESQCCQCGCQRFRTMQSGLSV